MTYTSKPGSVDGDADGDADEASTGASNDDLSIDIVDADGDADPHPSSFRIMVSKV
jgi:hypothetical protein